MPKKGGRLGRFADLRGAWHERGDGILVGGYTPMHTMSYPNSMLGGNKLNCFKAMLVLGGLPQILIWGSEIAKGPTR